MCYGTVEVRHTVVEFVVANDGCVVPHCIHCRDNRVYRLGRDVRCNKRERVTLQQVSTI